MKPEQQAAYDHTFRAIHDDEIPWQEGSKSVLKLPDGVQVKIFAHDKGMGRVDMKVKFPPGYVEPEHAHKSWHSIVVLKGRMCVAGKDLRPGDYVFGGTNCTAPTSIPTAARSLLCSWATASRINGTKRNTRRTKTSGRRKPRQAGKASTNISSGASRREKLRVGNGRIGVLPD